MLDSTRDAVRREYYDYLRTWNLMIDNIVNVQPMPSYRAIFATPHDIELAPDMKTVLTVGGYGVDYGGQTVV
jgi:hypothetical protein